MRQAGQQITCPGCEKPITVPTMRGIRQLSTAVEASDVKSEKQPWTRRQGILFASGLALALIAKGVAVAVNPIPVADILAAASIDAGLVLHLAKVYDLPPNRTEAGALVGVLALARSGDAHSWLLHTTAPAHNWLNSP